MPPYLSRGDLAALSTEAEKPGAMFSGSTVLSLLAEIARLNTLRADMQADLDHYALAALMDRRSEPRPEMRQADLINPSISLEKQ